MCVFCFLSLSCSSELFEEFVFLSLQGSKDHTLLCPKSCRCLMLCCITTLPLPLKKILACIYVKEEPVSMFSGKKILVKNYMKEEFLNGGKKKAQLK